MPDVDVSNVRRKGADLKNVFWACAELEDFCRELIGLLGYVGDIPGVSMEQLAMSKILYQARNIVDKYWLQVDFPVKVKIISVLTSNTLLGKRGVPNKFKKQWGKSVSSFAALIMSRVLGLGVMLPGLSVTRKSLYLHCVFFRCLSYS